MTKFIINKGIDNEFVFQIKQNGSIEGMVIAVSDTFIFNIKNPKTGAVIYTTIATHLDRPNGKIKVTIPASAVADFTREVGDRADHYYNKAVYSANIVATTTNNGKFVAKLNKVYVE